MPPLSPPLTWDDLAALPCPTPDATIAYGPAPEQCGDLWLPAGPGPFPLVVMVHGGCWQTHIADRRLMHRVAGDLRADGVAVWNIDYRGVDRPGGGYPGTFADAAAAADHVRVLAARYPLALDRIVTLGHSAGGHLALWLAARPHLPRDSALAIASPLPIDHVVSLGGLPDLEATAVCPENGCGTAVIADLVGTGRVSPYADTSIPRLLPLGVPQEIVHADDDRIVPRALATGYHERAVAAGDPAMLHRVPGEGHVELVTPGTAAWTLAKRLVVAALA